MQKAHYIKNIIIYTLASWDLFHTLPGSFSTFLHSTVRYGLLKYIKTLRVVSYYSIKYKHNLLKF